MSSSEHEFSLKEEVKAILGITRIYVKKSTLFMENKKSETIQCQHFKDDLLKTTNKMKEVLVACDEFIEADIDKFLRGFSDYCRQSEEEKEKEKEKQSSLDFDTKENKEGQPEMILRLLQERCQELFLDQFGTPFAAMRVRDHIEVVKISQRPGRLRNLVYKIYRESEDGSIPGSDSITSAICTLEADAESDGKIIELHLRSAYDPKSNDTLYYDLANPNWEVVKITPEGRSIEKSPVLFRRYRNNLPQVHPSETYDPKIFDKFMNLLNVKNEEHKLLLKCYIIAIFLPGFPEAILMLHGDPGAAKTTLQELIKMLVDPSSVLTLTLTKDQNELIQQLAQRRVVYFDNLSSIPEWISDLLCRATTGTGSSKRVLYTDEDELIYNFMRCIGFNGVNLAATKVDLLDRGLIIEVDKIENIRKIEEIRKEFEEIRPQLLAYIFDILVKVLRMKKTEKIQIEHLPRMSDFAENCEIISRCMGNDANLFLDAYHNNIKSQTQAALESSFLADVVIKFMEDKASWNDTSSKLLGELDKIGEELKPGIIKERSWPKKPHVLSRKLNEIKLTLGQIGLIIKRGQDTTGSKRFVEILKQNSSTAQNTETEGKYPSNQSQDSTITEPNKDSDPAHGKPQLPSFVFRLHPGSDIFGCKYCKYTDDKWGMAKHLHNEAQESIGIRKKASEESEAPESKKSLMNGGKISDDKYNDPLAKASEIASDKKIQVHEQNIDSDASFRSDAICSNQGDEIMGGQNYEENYDSYVKRQKEKFSNISDESDFTIEEP